MSLKWLNKEKRIKFRRLKRHRIAIEKFFDREFYLSFNPDVREAGGDPVEHYLKFGHDEGRNPHPDFDTRLYLQRNPDVARAGLNAFVHYIQFGQREGRTGEPYLDPVTDSPNIPDPFSGRVDVTLAEVEAKKFDVPVTSATMLTLMSVVPALAGLAIEKRLGVSAQSVTVRPRKLLTGLVERAIDMQKAGKAYVEPLGGTEIDQSFVEHVLAVATGKTLSFDIWDTLLRRSCCPDETKLRSARAIWLKWFRDSNVVRQLHPVDLFQLRRIAEAAVADEHFEYRIEDVAERLAEWLQVPSEIFVHDFLETEVRIEKAAVHPDAAAAAILGSHTGRKIAISDFYLSSKSLAEILSRGECGGIEKVYASCDYIKTKRAGDLFALVATAEGVEPAEIVHIGDRFDADVEMARSQGFTAFHYISPSHIERTAALDAALWGHVGGDECIHAARLLNLTAAEQSNDLPLSSMAIVATGFVLDIMERAIQTGVDKVYFCTREGAFFKRIYDALVAADQFDLGCYPESVLLEVSRRATFAASMEDFSIAELMRLWSQYSHQSLSALAITLNIDPELWRDSAERYGIELSSTIIYPWQDQRVKSFVADRKIRNHARNAIWEQRKNLLHYLERSGFCSSKPGNRLIVDIGWRGTIHDNISRVTGYPIHGCYLGLEKFLNPQPLGSSKSGYIMDVNAGRSFTIPEYAGLEFLFNAPGGSVTGYKDGQAVREIVSGEEELVCGVLKELQEGLLENVTSVAKYMRCHGLISSDIQNLSREILNNYCQEPPKEIVSAFFELEHNESFGVGATDVMTHDQKILANLQGLEGARLHGSLTRFLGNVRWNAAFVRSNAYRSFFDALTPSQKVAVPVSGAPALLRRESMGQTRIAILSPCPIKGSGGHRTVYNLARSLTKVGFDVQLMHERLADAETQDWVDSILDGTKVDQYSSWLSHFHPTAAVSTIWYSSFFVDDFWSNKTLPFYFVQDVEAHFNPVGDTYLKAERSYSLGHSHICIGRWLPHVLGTQFGMGAASAGLGVDHSLYGLLDGVQRRKKIAFLFQPEKYRRAPELCIQALQIVKEKVPDVEIDLYGSDDTWHVPFAYNHLGLIKDLHAINRIYNEASVGLCVSSTNPSRIPFEMMAAGCVPVDIYRYNNLFDYDDGTAMLAHASPASLADAMIRLLSNDEERNLRAEKGVLTMRDRTLTWETDVAVQAIQWALDGGRFDELATPHFTYSDEAVVAPEDVTRAVSQYLLWQRRLATMEREA